MKVLIIQICKDHQYLDTEICENQETWLVPDGLRTQDVMYNWRKKKDEYPQLYLYLESLGGELLDFEEIIK